MHIISKKYLAELQERYEFQQEHIKRRLKKVKEGKAFGEYDNYDDTKYFPAKLIKVLDEETGLILYEDCSLHTKRKMYITDLYVVGEKSGIY